MSVLAAWGALVGGIVFVWAAFVWLEEHHRDRP